MKKSVFNFSGMLQLRRGLAFMALVLTTALSGCETLSGGDCGEPSISQCNTYVTVTNAICGSGAFQNKWLQLDNGEFLQPFENQTGITALETGQRYRIGYEVMQRDKRYDYQVVCLALPPAAKAVRLLCMEQVETVEAQPEPTANQSKSLQ